MDKKDQIAHIKTRLSYMKEHNRMLIAQANDLGDKELVKRATSIQEATNETANYIEKRTDKKTS